MYQNELINMLLEETQKVILLDRFLQQESEQDEDGNPISSISDEEFNDVQIGKFDMIADIKESCEHIYPEYLYTCMKERIAKIDQELQQEDCDFETLQLERDASEYLMALSGVKECEVVSPRENNDEMHYATSDIEVFKISKEAAESIVLASGSNESVALGGFDKEFSNTDDQTYTDPAQ